MPVILTLFLPSGMQSGQDVAKARELLERVEKTKKAAVTEKILEKQDEAKLKSEFLWRLAVTKRIGISQTIRTKSLYPQLVIFQNGVPVSFYPQTYGSQKVSITEFLDELLKSKIRCLHEPHELEQILLGAKNEK